MELAYETYFLQNDFSDKDAGITNELTVADIQKLSKVSFDAAKKAADNYAAIFRDNIEAKIQNKDSWDLGDLSNTMNAFMATQTGFSAASELLYSINCWISCSRSICFCQ